MDAIDVGIVGPPVNTPGCPTEMPAVNPPATVLVKKPWRYRARSRTAYSRLRSAWVKFSMMNRRPPFAKSGCTREYDNVEAVDEVWSPLANSHNVLLANS